MIYRTFHRSPEPINDRLVAPPALLRRCAVVLQCFVADEELIRVDPKEVAIVRDNHGALKFYDGSAGEGKGTAFFLPPYCELGAPCSPERY